MASSCRSRKVRSRQTCGISIRIEKAWVNRLHVTAACQAASVGGWFEIKLREEDPMFLRLLLAATTPVCLAGVSRAEEQKPLAATARELPSFPTRIPAN